MKTKITVLLVLLTIAIQAQTITSWAKMAPLGDDLPNRTRANMVTYNNEIYIFGGYDSGANQGGDFAKYNPATGKLTNLKTFRTSVNNYEDRGLFEVNGKFYYIYGGSSLQIYDTTTGNWTSTVIDNSIITGFLLSNGGFVIDNTVYFIGTGATMIAYDTITKTFSKKANKPINVRGFFSFSIGSKGYMGGGTTCFTNGSCSIVNFFYEYDSVNDVWSAKALLPKGMEFGTVSIPERWTELYPHFVL